MFFSQAARAPPIETMYALLPRRMARTHLRRFFPVLRPIVVITPNPRGGTAESFLLHCPALLVPSNS
jgi:hypothetical protein